MNNCTIIGIDLGDKKHAVVGLDDKANIVLKRWIPNTKADLEALFRRNRRAVFGMRRCRINLPDRCYHLISRVAHRAFEWGKLRIERVAPL